MPIPIIVAVVASAMAAGGTGVGVAAYKDSKHNKEKEEWQNEIKKLQEKISEYQSLLKEREERIFELQNKLKEKEEQIERLTRSLSETDQMIMLLEKRQEELERFKTKLIAILLFRFRKNRVILLETISKLESGKNEQRRIVQLIDQTNLDRGLLEEDFYNVTKEHEIIADEIVSLNDKLIQMGA